MRQNIELTCGVIYSQHVMLALIENGLSREAAYDKIQPLAMQAWTEHRSFRQLLESSGLAAELGPEKLDQCFDPLYHLKNVDLIFDRVFGCHE